MGSNPSHLKMGTFLTYVLVIALALLPVAGAPRSWMLYIFLFFIYLAMANMWNLLAGYSGLISLCQPAFLGLSGYTMTIFTWLGMPWWVGLWAGAAVAGLFAILISSAVFRLSGIYFAIGTLVLPEALRILFYLWRPVGGEMDGGGAGYMIKDIAGVTMDQIYWFALIVGLGSLFVMRVILRSRLGLGLAAIRDNDRAAGCCGVNVFRLKLCIFVISAVITGMAGAVFYLYQGYIEPSATFSVTWTMTLLLATVIGGIRTEEGPIFGTVVVVVLYFLLAKYAGYSFLIQGAILIGIMLLSPQGIAGVLRRNRFYRDFSRAAFGGSSDFMRRQHKKSRAGGAPVPK
jgi:branched-chain amino acid transport system permease protein